MWGEMSGKRKQILASDFAPQLYKDPNLGT